MKPTQEQALDWAFECDFVESTPAEDVFSSIYVCCPKDIERLVTLAYEAGRKDENEACAKVCEEYQDAVDRHRWPNGYECADAIRAKGQQ